MAEHGVRVLWGRSRSIAMIWKYYLELYAKEQRDEYLIEGLGRHLGERQSQSALCYNENKEGKI
jgi:hypothetical protein